MYHKISHQNKSVMSNFFTKINAIKPGSLFILLIAVFLSSCSSSKSYFTSDTRNKIEQNSIPVDKLQYYIDKDVELKRELASGDATVKSGKVILENGKYVNLILLKKGTAGVCTGVYKNSLDISFESGESSSLAFAASNGRNANGAYSLDAEKWIKPYGSPEVGRVTYDGDVYFMRFSGARPKLMIKKTSTDKYEVNKRVMSGRKVE